MSSAQAPAPGPVIVGVKAKAPRRRDDEVIDVADATAKRRRKHQQLDIEEADATEAVMDVVKREPAAAAASAPRVAAKPPKATAKSLEKEWRDEFKSLKDLEFAAATVAMSKESKKRRDKLNEKMKRLMEVGARVQVRAREGSATLPAGARGMITKCGRKFTEVKFDEAQSRASGRGKGSSLWKLPYFALELEAPAPAAVGSVDSVSANFSKRLPS